jgi:Domain of unknown function (DUF4357)
MATHTTRGVTIRMFLVDGTPQGLRTVERMGWTGSFLAFARADYLRARTRPELAQSGAYVLVGPDPSDKRSEQIYVGETDTLRDRLDAHQKKKDFWTKAYVLTTKDDSLNKAHTRYLEARLLALAAVADVATLDNGTAPVPLRLSEPEVAEMETYLDNVLPLFPLVGVNVFERPEQEDVSPVANVEASTPETDDGPRLYFKTQLTEAEGEDRSRGFLVFSGARGRKATKVMMPSNVALRDRLLQEGILIEDGENVVLTKSFLFDSPSAAASVLSGGNKNGRTEWRDASGRTLKAIQEASAS